MAKRARPAKASKRAKAVPVAPGPLTGAQLAEVLRLIKGAGSVEMKLSVPAPRHGATIKSIGLDPVEAQPRQAYFFDTPDLALSKAGVVVRARRTQGGKADTVVKLRPVDTATIDSELRRSAAFKVEVDVMPGGFVCSASYKGVCTGREVLEVIEGGKSLRSLFSKEQRAFYDAHAPKDVTMDELAILGPTFLLKARHQPKDFDGRITVELWFYPDGSRILEISTKSLPENAFQAAAEFRAYLARCGIAIGAAQEPKTRTALEFFTARLKEEQAAG
ncbi:MAG: adenylate cyclase [Betaproteobacteria bacterium]|nr:adenylate cyclase [Betaproteobacteria bacterium]